MAPGLRDGQQPNEHDKEQALRGSQKGVSIVGKILAVLTSLMLLAIIGLSVAPLCAFHEGWAYYRHNNIGNNVANVPQGRLRILAGWYKFHTTAGGGYMKNSSISRAGVAVPAVVVAFLLLSALTALFYLLLSCCTTLGSKSKNSKVSKTGKTSTGIVQTLLTCVAPIIGLSLILWAIAAYIVLAVNLATYSRRNLGANYMAWPDWAFFLTIGAGLTWLLLAPLTAFAAATSAASRGLDGKNKEDFQSGHQGQDVHEHDDRQLLDGQRQQKQQQSVPMNTMNQNQNQNGANSNTTQSQTHTGNGQHWQNMEGYVVSPDIPRGPLAKPTYENLV